MLEPGERMPEFSLRDADRERVTNDSFSGEITVIAFYPMSFTGG